MCLKNGQDRVGGSIILNELVNKSIWTLPSEEEAAGGDVEEPILHAEKAGISVCPESMLGWSCS